MSNQILTTGTPQSKRMTTGRLWASMDGIVYFDLGNVTKFKRTDKTEKALHYASRNGARKVDYSVNHTVEFGYMITVDEVSDWVLRLQNKTVNYSKVTGVAGAAATYPIVGVIAGASYVLNVNGGVQVTGVALTAGGGGALISGIDYRVDEAAGMIEFLASSPNVGVFAAGNYTVTYNQLATSFATAPTGSESLTVSAWFRFIETDQGLPITGAFPTAAHQLQAKVIHIFYGQVTCDPSPEFQGTEFQTADLSIVCSDAPSIAYRTT